MRRLGAALSVLVQRDPASEIRPRGRAPGATPQPTHRRRRACAPLLQVHGVDGDEPTPEWGNATTSKKRDDRLSRLHKLEEESIRALDDPTIEQAPVPSPHVRAKQHASVAGDQRRPPQVREFRPLRPRNVPGGARSA